jgi:tRNA (guanine37-N1)-methyltransferase
VPDVLLSGNHADIRRWRKRAAVTRTLERRPELLAGAVLDQEEREILQQLRMAAGSPSAAKKLATDD